MNKHAESPGTGPVARVLVSLICLFCMGCGGDSKFDDGSVATGTLSVTHQLERGVPDRVDGFHYACLDADGNTVMEFSLKEKASEHLLENVPVTCRVLYTTYYDRVDGAALTEQASEAVGDSKAPVEVQAGKRSKVAIIGDPTAKVYITGSNGQYTLEVDDNAFFMQGVGGDYSSAEYAYTYLNDTLQNSHVNTIRTYGVGDSGVTITAAQAALAQAKALTKDDTRPVMVIVGLDLNDAADPRTYARAVFNGLIGDPNADHILAWCISNEWVSLTDATDPNNATVDAVSKWIQQQTPRTLTMAAIQHPSEGSLNIITTSMPTLDFIGINSFYGSFNADWAGGGFLNLLSGYISELGKPWCLTEYYSYDLPSEPFGDYKGMPRQTLNGSTDYYLELNSTSNARNYADVWNDYVVGNQPNGCLGGCALNWGPPHNSQCNAFWKQMFTYGGQWELYVDWYAKYGVRRLQCVDAVIGAYGGTPDAAACPGIVLPADKDPQGIDCDFKADLNSAGRSVSTDEVLTATVTAEGTGSLTFNWYLVGGKAVLLDPSGGTTGGIWEGPSYNTYQAWGADPVTSINLGQGTSTDLGNGKTSNTITFSMHDPSDPTKTAYAGNNYQLRVIVSDGNNGAATAAVGFSVEDGS